MKCMEMCPGVFRLSRIELYPNYTTERQIFWVRGLSGMFNYFTNDVFIVTHGVVCIILHSSLCNSLLSLAIMHTVWLTP